MPNAAYSFINVQASIVGPGGNLSIGNSAGSAEEGITIEMVEDKGDTKVGADGLLMQTLRASNLGRITIRLLKTSTVNAQLNQMYNLQKSLSAAWGQNVIVVSDTARGDLHSGTQMAFTKQPSITYAKDANTNEWVFTGNVQELLGIGQPALTATP